MNSSRLSKNYLKTQTTAYKNFFYIAANNDTEQACKEAITTLLQHHDKTKNANGTVCMMGKYHNILYVAVKLCYLWQLQDAGNSFRDTNEYVLLFDFLSSSAQKMSKFPLVSIIR